jgi:hypothetical protein
MVDYKQQQQLELFLGNIQVNNFNDIQIVNWRIPAEFQTVPFHSSFLLLSSSRKKCVTPQQQQKPILPSSSSSGS